jgi:hypothetical protein
MALNFPMTPPGGPSPASAPPQEGLRAQARVKLGEAAKLLIDALGLLKEVGSDEGKAALTALKALGPVTPDVQEGLGRSELASLLAASAPVRPGMGKPMGAPPTMLGTPRPQPAVMAGPPLGGERPMEGAA